MEFLGTKEDEQRINNNVRANLINSFCQEVNAANAKWWQCLDCDKGYKQEWVERSVGAIGCGDKVLCWIPCYKCNKGLLKRNVGEMLALVHSEISEGLEGSRKNLMDDKLPHRSMFEVELADAVIRIFNIAGGLNLDLGGAFVEKMAFNAVREDHKLENRMREHGKKY